MNALHTLARASFFTILLGLLAAPGTLLAQSQTNDPLVDQQQYLFDVHRVDQAWSYTTGSSNVKIGVYSQTGFIQNHEDLSSSRLASPVGTLLEPELDIASEMVGIVGARTNNNVGMAGIDRAATLQSYSVLTENSTCGSDSRCSGDEEDTVTFERPDGTQETYHLNLYRYSDQLNQGRDNGVDVHLFSFGLPSGDPADYDPTLEEPPDPDESMDLFDRDPDDVDDPDPYKTLATAALNTIKSIGDVICGGWFGSCTTPPDPGSLFRDEVGFAVAKDGGVVVTPAGNLDGDGDMPPRHLPGMFDPYTITVGGMMLNANDQRVPWDSTRPAAYVDVSAFADKVVGVSGAGSDQYDTDFTTTAASASIGAGVSGLLKAEMPVLTGEDIEEILKRTARDAGSPGRDDYTGTGAIDAEAALSFVRNNDVQRSRQSVQSITSDEVVATEVELNGNRYWDYVSFDYQNCPKAKGELHKFKARIPYSQTFSSTPDVWVRWGGSDGVVSSSTEGVSYYDPLAKRLRVISADRTGLKIEGYYWKADYFNSAGGQCANDVRIPKAPKNFNVAYTATGTEGPPPLEVSLSGPSQLNSGEEGTWTASVSGGGSGDPSYDWEYQPACPDSRKSPNRYCGWSPKNCSGPDCSHTFSNNTDETMDGGIRVTVTKGTQSETDSKTVTVSPGGGSSSTTASGGSFGTPAQRHSPVLRDLDAQSPSNETVTLTWQATGSPLPARFVMEHRADTTGAWSQVGTVAASDSAGAAPAGTIAYRYRAEDLAPGTHQFRLVVVPDRKAGARRASEAVTVRVDLDAAYRLSTYPNPVRERATVELAVRKRQDVQVRLHDVLGRRVGTLHDGPLPAEELRRLRLDAPATGLTSGQYFLRVTGEEFAATEQITVVR